MTQPIRDSLVAARDELKLVQLAVSCGSQVPTQIETRFNINGVTWFTSAYTDRQFMREGSCSCRTCLHISAIPEGGLLRDGS